MRKILLAGLCLLASAAHAATAPYGGPLTGVGDPITGMGFNRSASVVPVCDKVAAFTTLGTTATVQQIAAVATQKIYICGWLLFGSTATTGVDLTWSEGTGANCVTGNAVIGGKFLTTPTAVTTTPNSTLISPIGLAFTATAGDALCITQSSTANATTLAGLIFYTQG